MFSKHTCIQFRLGHAPDNSSTCGTVVVCWPHDAAIPKVCCSTITGHVEKVVHVHVEIEWLVVKRCAIFKPKAETCAEEGGCEVVKTISAYCQVLSPMILAVLSFIEQLSDASWVQQTVVETYWKRQTEITTHSMIFLTSMFNRLAATHPLKLTCFCMRGMYA